MCLRLLHQASIVSRMLFMLLHFIKSNFPVVWCLNHATPINRVPPLKRIACFTLVINITHSISINVSLINSMLSIIGHSRNNLPREGK